MCRPGVGGFPAILISPLSALHKTNGGAALKKGGAVKDLYRFHK